MQPQKKLIAERLWIPADTKAILWDMDGVLIESLNFNLVVCNQFLARHFGEQVTIEKALIRSLFAYEPIKIVESVLTFVEKTYLVPEALKLREKMFKAFQKARSENEFDLNPGISHILKAAQFQSLKMAVVSNNLTVEVKNILKHSHIFDYFEEVVGNDLKKVAKKPAPDTYLLAAQLLEVKPEKCVVIEDTLIGLEAGYKANCYTIGVATGGEDFETLKQSQWAQQVYSSFEMNS